MRRLLHQLGARQGVSLGLLIAIALVIVVAKLLPHNGADPLTYDGVVTDPTSTATVAPAPGRSPTTAPATGPLLHRPAPPSSKAGVASPQSVAKSFATAWLHNDVAAAVWLRNVTKYTTSAVATQLAEADPANVPATRVTHAVTVVDDAADRCEVKVPMDTGTLLLTLQLTDGHWLVDNIDWDEPVPSAPAGGTP